MNADAPHLRGQSLVRDVVGVFVDGNNIETAIQKLKKAGFWPEKLGLLAHSDAVSQKLGHLYDAVSLDANCTENPEYCFVEKHSAKSAANAFLGGLGIVASAAASGMIVASAAVLAGPVGAATAGATVVGGIGALTLTIMSESDSQRL